MHFESTTRTCPCGQEFYKSRTDSTRRCPDCRAGRKRPKLAACVVCLDERVIRFQRADGKMDSAPCYRCSR